MSAIGWLESSELFPFVWARNFGLKQVEQFDWFKDRFMRQSEWIRVFTAHSLCLLKTIFLKQSFINQVNLVIKSTI